MTEDESCHDLMCECSIYLLLKPDRVILRGVPASTLQTEYVMVQKEECASIHPCARGQG